MRSLVFTSALATILVGPFVTEAGDRYAPRPPVLVNPASSDGWQQYQAGSHTAPTVPVPRERAPLQKVSARVPAAIVPPPPLAKPSRSFDPAFLPTVINYTGPEAPGTIVIDTEARYLYLVQSDGSARRYGVGVGKPGFEWAGEHRITRKSKWPSWTPPPEMIARRPGLPRHMEGGPRNPLGARALYLGSTLYRIHGSNEPWSIGRAVSSGCIRMRNEDVTDLYDRVGVGTKVIVM